jgi:hypothetical protein
MPTTFLLPNNCKISLYSFIFIRKQGMATNGTDTREWELSGTRYRTSLHRSLAMWDLLNCDWRNCTSDHDFVNPQDLLVEILASKDACLSAP